MSEPPETTYSNAELFKRMQDMHRSWIERLREIRQIESDFGSRLLNAKNPMEATMVCTEWMARRLETVASEQQTFATAWLGLISNAVKSARPAATESPESSYEASRCALPGSCLGDFCLENHFSFQRLNMTPAIAVVAP